VFLAGEFATACHTAETAQLCVLRTPRLLLKKKTSFLNAIEPHFPLAPTLVGRATAA